VKKRFSLIAIVGVLVLALAAPVFAAGDEVAAAAGGGTSKADLYKWSLITGAFALALAAAVCGLSQCMSIVAACNGISRNPGAAPQIRFALIFGLVLIESLAIYVLLVALIIFFVKWGAYP